MEKRKIVVAGVAALALGGIGAGTALASSPAPAHVAVPAVAQIASFPGESGQGADIPEPGDTPDQGATPGAPDTDNVQFEGTGNQGN